MNKQIIIRKLKEWNILIDQDFNSLDELEDLLNNLSYHDNCLKSNIINILNKNDDTVFFTEQEYDIAIKQLNLNTSFYYKYEQHEYVDVIKNNKTGKIFFVEKVGNDPYINEIIMDGSYAFNIKRNKLIMDIRVMLLKDKLHTNNETKKVAKI
jgi:hypothetical protein